MNEKSEKHQYFPESSQDSNGLYIRILGWDSGFLGKEECENGVFRPSL